MYNRILFEHIYLLTAFVYRYILEDSFSGIGFYLQSCSNFEKESLFFGYHAAFLEFGRHYPLSIACLFIRVLGLQTKATPPDEDEVLMKKWSIQ